MKLQFYKTNPKTTGTGCSFWKNADDNTFWASLIKQGSWNEKTKTGTFQENKDNPQKRVIIKFSAVEIAGFIDAIQRNAEYTGYHGSQKQVVKYKFCPYMRNEEQIGFSFSVNREAKEDSTDKQSYIIGFYWAEATQLKLFLEEMLRESFKEAGENKKTKFTSAPADRSPKKAEKNNDEDDYDF